MPDSKLIVDIALAFMIAEGPALIAFRRLTGRGVPPLQLAGILLSGLPLMLALRLALGGVWWGWIALCLVAALVAHGLDLRRRWSP